MYKYNQNNALARRKLTTLFATVLMLCGIVLGLASCSDEGYPVDNLQPVDLAGKWYAENSSAGRFEADGVTIEYERIVQYADFHDNGTGFWSIFFINAAGQAQDIPGYYCGGNFTYIISDSTIAITQTSTGIPILKDNWNVDYQDGKISVQNATLSKAMEPITEEQEEFVQYWLQGLGFGASADSYNINDEDFTPTTWRDQEAIYIYDGTGNDITDAKGRTGYTLVNMPWFKGDVLTNLPEGFCDDITPENGWEWVLNRCGSRSIVNNNFFAVYNKYTGILRFFYYLPYGFSTGNDHVWQVSMTDHIAQWAVWRYGIPEDKAVVDKATIGQTGQGTYMFYTTPWTNYMSDDGFVTPNAGWWAFDVDMSLYHPTENLQNDNIRVQMRSWTSQHVSLNSTITAAIDGDIKQDLNADINMIETQHLSNSTMGVITKLGSIGGSIYSSVNNFMEGKTGDGISAAIEAGKTGCNLAGIKTDAARDYDGTLKGFLDGTITLGMDGTIDTEGTIRGSAPTVGIASPTFFLKDFDLENSLVGRGVWNIKSSPVVYYAKSLSSNYGAEDLFDYIPQHVGAGLFTFLDPSSIEVELNPALFPEDKIEWMEVDACRGVRPSLGFEGTDAYRQAFGLVSREMIDEGGWSKWYSRHEFVDFMHYAKDRHGLAEKAQIPWHQSGIIYRGENQRETAIGCGIVKDGDTKYVLEPQPVQERWDVSYKDHIPLRFPAEEVTVMVTIKMKDFEYPFVYSRMYLPEYVEINLHHQENREKLYKKMHSKANLSPKTIGHTDFYDYSVKRMDIFFNNTFEDSYEVSDN